MILCAFIISQWVMDNPEAKYYDPNPYIITQRAESTHTYDVLHYDLNVTLPMTQRSLEGINKIACRSRTNGLTTLILHSYSLTIDSVLVDGNLASFGTSGDSVLITLPQTYNNGDSFYVEVGYHGSWTVTYDQIGFVYYPKNWASNILQTIAYVISEPWDARRWMPCYDEPYDKADYGCSFSITVPDTFVVCANGELVSVTSNPNNTATFTWQEKYPITTYLMHFAASRYAVWSQWWYSGAGDSIEIRHFVWPQDSAQSITAFQHLPEAMTLYDSLYGPYPFDRYGQDVVYRFVWGGMEHQEMTTIHRSWLLNASENGMAHELSHQWWGDMVTCVDFRDIWLNEGCATYSDANYNWYRFGHTYFLNTMETRLQYYFQEDNSWRHPLYDPPPGELFNYGYTYCKAMWVMHMLRYLNQDVFFPAMAVYRDSFEYACASTEDMKAIFSQTYGTDLTWFFNEWVYGQGHPEYEIYWDCTPAGNDYNISLAIYQVQTNAPPVFHMPVEITLHMTSADTLVTIPISSSPEYFDVVVSDSVTSITFDPDFWLIKEYQIYYGVEEIVNDAPVFNDFFFASNPTRRPCITYTVNQPGMVRFSFYDVSGRLCHTCHEGVREHGTYTIHLNALNPGIYFCRMETPVNKTVRKLVVIE